MGDKHFKKQQEYQKEKDYRKEKTNSVKCNSKGENVITGWAQAKIGIL